jgi:hypothetical protein
MIPIEADDLADFRLLKVKLHILVRLFQLSLKYLPKPCATIDQVRSELIGRVKPILNTWVQTRVLAKLALHPHCFQQLKYIDVNFLNLRSSWVIGWLPCRINFILTRIKSASFPVVRTTYAEDESAFLFIQTFETDVEHVILRSVLRVLLVSLPMQRLKFAIRNDVAAASAGD